MSQLLVKILSACDGEPRPKHLQVWHLAVHISGNQTYCQGEFFGGGESGCTYETKTVDRGGITCTGCLEQIRMIKGVKL